MDRIISIAFLAWFVLSSVVFFAGALVLWLLTAAFDRRLVLLHRYTCFWASVYLWTMPAWSVTTEGREKIRRDGVYVVVSNHQSLVDILVGFRLFFHFKWVSKAEVFRLPLIGWNMVLNRYIKLRRGDLKSVRHMLADAEAALASGSSVFLFPEGTRSASGKVKRFKPGAFALAQKMKTPILPIAIRGSKDALPKKSLIIHGRHRIHVKVLEEMPYAAFAELPAAEVAKQVRTLIRREVEPSGAGQTEAASSMQVS